MEWQEDFGHTYDDRFGPPRAEEDVVRLLAHLRPRWWPASQEAWSAALAVGIWKFVRTHPSCRLEDDEGNVAWRKGEITPSDRSAYAYVYAQIGSRYDFDHLLVGYR